MSTREKMAQQYADEQWPTLKGAERDFRNEPEFLERDSTVEGFLAGFEAGAEQMRERCAKASTVFGAKSIRALPLDDESEGA